MVKPLTFAPHKVLNHPAKKVGKLDRRTKAIIADMKDTLKAADNPKGVGLAAVQIGIPLQIFVMRAKEKDPMTVCINPKITSFSKELSSEPGNHKNRPKGAGTLEGCLSIKNIWGTVKRSKKVRMKYMDEKGNIKEEEFSGFPAHIVQHEVDHLQGILYTQRALEQNGKLFHPTLDDDGKEILEEFEL